MASYGTKTTCRMLILLPTALIPLIVGAVYYHPKVAGTAWMRANHFTEEDLKGANMGLTFGLSFVMSILLALLLQTIVIHQMGGVLGQFAPLPIAV